MTDWNVLVGIDLCNLLDKGKVDSGGTGVNMRECIEPSFFPQMRYPFKEVHLRAELAGGLTLPAPFSLGDTLWQKDRFF